MESFATPVSLLGPPIESLDELDMLDNLLEVLSGHSSCTPVYSCRPIPFAYVAKFLEMKSEET